MENIFESFLDSLVLESETDKESMKNLVGIGFCQPKFYKPTIWGYANKLMLRASELNLAFPKDYGRGKGKYSTAKSFAEVEDGLLQDDVAMAILEKYKKYVSKLKA